MTGYHKAGRIKLVIGVCVPEYDQRIIVFENLVRGVHVKQLVSVIKYATLKQINASQTQMEPAKQDKLFLEIKFLTNFA